KLQNEEYRLAIYDKDSFDRDHPLSADRIQALQLKLQLDPAYKKPIDPALEARFERVKAKLLGYVNPRQAVLKYPESDQSIPAHYARAYAYHLSGFPDKAQAEDDKVKEAIAPLREAVQRSGNAPMIAAMLGHALVETNDPKNFDEAKQILKVAVNRDNEDPFAW